MIHKSKVLAQIKESHARVIYTYTAHHKMVDNLEHKKNLVKILMICLTSVSTAGFLATIIISKILLSWIGGACSALSLGLTLFIKEFDFERDIKLHKEAADALWLIREKYKSLITDFDVLSTQEIIGQRDFLINEVDNININYPKTSKSAYKKARKALKIEEEQTFNDGEVEKFLPPDKDK